MTELRHPTSGQALRLSRIVHVDGARLVVMDLEAEAPIDVAPEVIKALDDLAGSAAEAPDPVLLACVEELVAKRVLVPVEQREEREVVPWKFDVEITRHCNSRCDYCPVAIAPKSAAVMELDLYERIIGQISPLRIKRLAFSHYNEPLLDPHFEQRLKIAAQAQIPIKLVTNGTLLNEKNITWLAAYPRLKAVIINLPSADQERYRAITNNRHLARVIDGIRELTRNGVRVDVLVRDGQEAARELQTLRELLPAAVNVIEMIIDNRAGRVEGATIPPQQCSSSLLGGCGWFLRYMSISVEGKAFMCCQDYDQVHTYGDFRTQTLDEILASEALLKLRSQVFGAIEAPQELLCRRCSHLFKRSERSFSPLQLGRAQKVVAQ